MATTTEEIAIKLGVRLGDFKAALADAGASVKKLKKDGEGGMDGFNRSLAGAQKGINTFKQVLAGAGIVGIVKGLTEAGVEFAQSWTGAYDEAVAATLRLKQEQNDIGSIIKNVSGRIGVELIGAMDKFGVAVGAMVYGTEAAADAFDKMEEASKKAFDEQRAAKIAAAEERLAKIRAEAAGGVEKLNFLLSQQSKLEAEREKFAKGTAEYISKTADIEEARLAVTKELTAQSKIAEEAAKKAADEATKAEKEQADARKRGYEEQAEIWKKLGELYDKEHDARLESMTLIERQNVLLGEEAELARELAGLEEGTIEFNETYNDLLDVRAKLRKTEEEAAKANKEIATLLLVDEGKRTELEKERLKLLTGETTEHEQAVELQGLLARGIQNLSASEKDRLLTLVGQTTELEKQAAAAERQAAALQAHFNKSIKNEGDIGSLSNDALKELTAVIKKQLAQSEAETLHQRQPTVLEAGFLAQLESIKVELEKRRDFQQVSKFMSQANLEVKFGQSEFSRLSSLFSSGADQQKRTADAVTRMEQTFARVFPDAYRNVR